MNEHKYFNRILSGTILCLCLGTAHSAGLNTDDPKTIVADKIEYNVRDKSIATRGNTEITNASGQKMTLVDSYIGDRGMDVSGSDIDLSLSPQTQISAKNVDKKGEITNAARATYTNCYNCDPFGNAWEISAKRLVHNNEKHTVDFHNMVFWIYDIPVLWLPVLYDYPDPTVKRKTGLLYPSFNTTNGMGRQINLPLYVTLSDTHDFTVTASYLTDENPLWQLEHRLNTKHATFRTKGSYTHNQAGDDRWHVFNNDVIEMGEHARATLRLQRTSDKTYLQKYGFYGNQPYLDSGGKVELFASSGYVTAEAHVFQELRTTSNIQTTVPSGDILPNIHGIYQTDTFFHDTYVSFMGDILGVQNFSENTASQRAIGEVRLTSPWTLPLGGRLTASASARYDVYNFRKTAMLDGDDSFSGMESRFLPSGYLEWAMPLVRASENIIQTITPRLRLTTMAEQDNRAFAVSNDSAGALLSDASLFSTNRYSGYDLWQSGTYADYGVSWAAFDRAGRTAEVFFGQTYDFSEPIAIDPNSGYHDGASDYVGRIYLNTGKWFSTTNRFRFANENFKLRHLETTARVGGRNYVEFGYIWAAQFLDAVTLDKSINEAVVGFGVNLTDRFSIKYNAIYNITDKHIQKMIGGLYYEHPCYNIAFEYLKDNAVKEDYVGRTTFHFKFGIKLGTGGK